MSSSCVINPPAKNGKDSKLWKSLSSVLGREDAKTWYGVATSQDFLDEAQKQKGIFVTDENGEITIKSLMSLSSEFNAVVEQKRDGILDREVKVGVEMDFNEAANLVASFNASISDNLKGYMATMFKSKNGKYETKIVARNSKNIAQLSDFMKTKSIRNRIVFYLNSMGVGIDFIDKNMLTEDRFNSNYASQMMNGLYNLFNINNSERVDSNLAEVMGHMSIGVMSNSPIVGRLFDSLRNNEKLIDQLFSKEDAMFIKSRKTQEDPEGHLRTAAALLVARNLLESEYSGTLGNLINRITNLVKNFFQSARRKVFGNRDTRAMLKDVRDINQAIDKIVFETTKTGAFNSFDTLMFIEQNFDQISRLEFKEKYDYLQKPSDRLVVLNEIVDGLKRLANEMKVIDKSLFAKYSLMANNIEFGVYSNVTVENIFQKDTIHGITNAINMMLANIPTIEANVNSVIESDCAVNKVNSDRLREARAILKNAASINEVVANYLSKLTEEDLEGKDEGFLKNIEVLRAASDTLHKTIVGDSKSSILNSLLTTERKLYCNFLELIHKDNKIRSRARILFDGFKGFKPTLKRMYGTDAEAVDISDLVEILEQDVSFMGRFFKSATSTADAHLGIVDNAIKLFKTKADNLVEQTFEELKVIDEMFKDLDMKQSDLYSRDADGNFDGYILAPLDYALYEKNWNEFKENCQKEFFESLSEVERSTLSKNILSMKFESFFKPRRKLWHKSNSIFNKEKKKYGPNNNYTNPKFFELIGKTPGQPQTSRGMKIEKLYEFYMEIKERLDGNLEDGSTNLYRLPQFIDGTIYRFKNRMQQNNTNRTAFGKFFSTVYDTISEAFVETSDNETFGTDLTYNSMEDGMFSNRLSFELEKINRVNVFGVTMLKNKNNISTDLINSTLAYAGMSYNYATMSGITSMLEVGRNVMLERRVGGILPESKRNDGFSNSYKRYYKLLEKNLYNINISRNKIGKFDLVKMVNSTLQPFAAAYFLGGNVVGGLAGGLNAMVEVTKKAITGVDFNVKDLTWALKTYMSEVPANFAQAGIQAKDNKVDLIRRRYNVAEENKALYATYKGTRGGKMDKLSRLSRLNPFGGNLYLFYSSAEHLVQTLPLLAFLNKEVVYYEEDGEIKQKSLYDAYETPYISENHKAAGKKLLLESKYMTKNEHGELVPINQVELEHRLASLNRDINNNMHGIYNRLDSTVFQQNIAGAMVMSMKKFILGVVNNFYSSNNYNSAMKDYNEGIYTSVAKLAVAISPSYNNKSLGMTMGSMLMPYTEMSKQFYRGLGFHDRQIGNIRAAWIHGLTLMVFSLLKVLLAKPSGDDDDEEEESIAAGIAYYFLTRLKREQAALTTPLGLMSEFKTNSDITPIAIKASIDLYEITNLMIGAATGDESAYYKQDGKGYEEGDPKFLNKLERKIPYWKSWLILADPYSASKNYEYGRYSYTR